jgi:hypothetical protein
MRGIFRHLLPNCATELYSDERGNIDHRKAISGHIFGARESRIQFGESLPHPLATSFRKLWDLLVIDWAGQSAVSKAF